MDFENIYKVTAPFTMTNKDRMRRLYESVVYVNDSNIPGDFVECGVYRGGSVMNMALTQLNFPRKTHIYLYDTFAGMTDETKEDVNYRGESAAKILKNPKKKCICSLDQVKKNIKLTGYPEEFLHYCLGDVAETLKLLIPQQIAILRLDTDWYASTKIELEILYPRLVKDGVLILDDYGYWRGARKATEDYFQIQGISPKFESIDKTLGAVIYIKNG